MEARKADEIKAKLREMGEYMLDPENVPRHPRGYQGSVTFDEVILVVRCKDAQGRYYICDPVELQPGQGETPQADVFLRDYAVVGTKRGTSLIDVVFRLLPVIGGGGSGGSGGGWLDVLGTLFGRKTK